MLKFYRIVLTSCIIAVGLAACNENDVDVTLPPGGVVDSSHNSHTDSTTIDTVVAKKQEPDSIHVWIPFANPHFMKVGGADLFDSAAVFPRNPFGDRYLCVSTNTSVVTADTVRIAGIKGCKWHPAGVSALISGTQTYVSTQVYAQSLDALTLPDCSSDRVTWGLNIVVTPTGSLEAGYTVMLPAPFMRIC